MKDLTTHATHRAVALTAVLTLLVAAFLAVGASPADSLARRTVFFSTLEKCNAGKGAYSGSFTRITQDCTYSGSYLFGWKLDKGPYFITYETR